MQEMTQAEAQRQEEHYKQAEVGNWGLGKRGVADIPGVAGKPEEVGKREEVRFAEHWRERFLLHS